MVIEDISKERLPLVSIDELSITLGVSASTIRNWLRAGFIPTQTYIRVGNTYRFEQEDVIRALKDLPESAGVNQIDKPESPYIDAAEKGDVHAQYFLACLYADGGFNVQHDARKSRHWYKKAAEQGHEEAQKMCLKIKQKYKISNADYWLDWLSKHAPEEALTVLEEQAAEALRDDKDFIRAAIQYSGAVFEFASVRLKNDHNVLHCYRSFWIDWIRNSYDSLDSFLTDNKMGLPKHLSDDKKFILQAIDVLGEFYLLGSDRVKNDEKVIRATLGKEPTMLHQMELKHQQNPDFVRIAIETAAFQIPNTLYFETRVMELIENLPSNLLDDKNFIMWAIDLPGCSTSFFHASSKLKSDKEVALEAVRINSENLLYVDPILSSDPDLMLEAEKVWGGQDDLEKNY